MPRPKPTTDEERKSRPLRLTDAVWEHLKSISTERSTPINTLMEQGIALLSVVASADPLLDPLSTATLAAMKAEAAARKLTPDVLILEALEALRRPAPLATVPASVGQVSSAIQPPKTPTPPIQNTGTSWTRREGSYGKDRQARGPRAVVAPTEQRGPRMWDSIVSDGLYAARPSTKRVKPDGDIIDVDSVDLPEPQEVR